MKTISLLVALLFTLVPSFAGDVVLKMETSGKIVAQKQLDPNGGFSFENLPDGKYKLEFSVGGKRYSVCCDVDGDGMGDFEIITPVQKAGVSTSRSNVRNRSMQVGVDGKIKNLTLADWMAKSKPQSVPAGEIALQVEVANNTIKGTVRCSDGSCK